MKDVKVPLRLESIEHCVDCPGYVDSPGGGLGHVCFDKTLRMSRSGKHFDPRDYVIKDPLKIPRWCPLRIVSSQGLFELQYGPDRQKK